LQYKNVVMDQPLELLHVETTKLLNVIWDVHQQIHVIVKLKQLQNVELILHL
jgi:hypothetical protein